jgi:hypothetical protein
MLWLIVNGAAILLVIVMMVIGMMEGAEVCNCSDILLEMTTKAKAANGDQKKLEALEKKYKKDMESCQKLFTDTEKFKDESAIQKELNKCPSYKKLKKLSEPN